MSIIMLLLGWIVVYTVIGFALSRYTDLPDWLSITGPFTSLRSQKGLTFIENISQKYKSQWGKWGTLGVGFSYIGIVGGTLLIGTSALAALLTDTSGVETSARNYLAIPGVNDFLPLSAAVEIISALLIAMVVHEAGHAIMCRIHDMDIKSTGIFSIALIPMGAFVEPNDESVESSPVLQRLKMYAGGIMNNVAATVICFVGFILIVSTLITPVAGAGVDGVLQNSPGENAGLEAGDVIVAVDGEEVSTHQEAAQLLAENSASSVPVTLESGEEVTLDRTLFLRGVSSSSNVEVGDEVVSVNGESVSTRAQFEEIVRDTDSKTVAIEFTSGVTVDHTIGAEITPQEDTPATDAGLNAGDSMVVTSVNGERVYSSVDFRQKVSDAGETVTFTVTDNGEETEYTLTEEEGMFGVSVSPGYNGLVFDDVGLSYYPKEEVHNMITGGSILDKLGALIILPFATLHAGFTFTFPGFTPMLQSFFSIPIASGIPGAEVGIFFTASLLFWTFWINVNLALFNCLPIFPLDGGHILRGTTEYLSDYFDWEFKHEYISAVVGAVVILLLVALLFGS